MGTSLLLNTVLIGLIGLGSGDQSSLPLGYPQEEVTAPLGYPIEGNDAGLTAGGYYSQYPTTAGGQYDYSGLGAYGATDRITDVLSLPMVITAFLSAVVGGILAPLVTRMASRLGDVELPRIPEIPKLDIPEIPELPLKKVTPKRKTKSKTKSKGRSMEEDLSW